MVSVALSRKKGIQCAYYKKEHLYNLRINLPVKSPAIFFPRCCSSQISTFTVWDYQKIIYKNAYNTIHHCFSPCSSLEDAVLFHGFEI